MLGRSATLAKPEAREARRAHVEGLILTASCPCQRRWAARELGKIWAEETLDEIRKALA